MNFYTNSFIFKLLSYLIKPFVSSKLRFEDLAKLEKNKNIVYALASESLIDLVGLNELCKKNNLISPLGNLPDVSSKRYICLKSPKYLISEQRFKRQKTHNLEEISRYFFIVFSNPNSNVSQINACPIDTSLIFVMAFINVLKHFCLLKQFEHNLV